MWKLRIALVGWMVVHAAMLARNGDVPGSSFRELLVLPDVLLPSLVALPELLQVPKQLPQVPVLLVLALIFGEDRARCEQWGVFVRGVHAGH